ncbi:hypothetical protein ACET3Z_017304 [Daucus carota]
MEREVAKLLNSTLQLKQFKQVHAVILTNRLKLQPLFTLKLLLVPHSVDYDRQLFDKIPQTNQSLYNSIISACSKLSLNNETIEKSRSMRCNNILIHCYTVILYLRSCFCLLDDNIVKQVHCLVIRCGLDSTVYVQTALVDFYAKMGEIDSAKHVFNGVVVKDSVCYNCLISGYSKAGDVEKARLIFDEMEDKTVVSWNSMLSCYAHNGDYSEVFRIFERMQIERCRANEYTVAMLLSMKVQPNAVIWGTLLAASKFHLNVELAEICVNKLVELEPENSGNYVLLSNIYASVDRWQEASLVRNLMKGKKFVQNSCI